MPATIQLDPSIPPELIERYKQLRAQAAKRSYNPHKPHPPQQTFLDLDCAEAFYGGAVGGGKSDAILMAALQYVDVPGYAALILRKTFAQLHKSNQSIMTRAQEWLANTDAVWRGDDHAFTFPSGARLEFGHLQHSKDRYNYQGAEYQFIGFDELTQFEQNDYLYLHSRLRRPQSGPLSRVPLRVRSAGNPGGIGHHWVRSRFVKREPQQDEEESPPADDRLFVQAKLPDNPSVDRPSYEKQLKHLDIRTRKMYLDGDWDIREPGACFVEFDWDRNTLDGTRPLDTPYDAVRAIDWGLHHMPVLWIEVQPNQVFVFDEWHGRDTKIPLMAEAVKVKDREHELQTDSVTSYVDPAGMGTSYQTGIHDIEMLRGAGIPVDDIESRYGREERCALIKVLLEQQRLWISRDRCPDLIECLERAVWDKHGVDGALKDTYKKDGKWDHHLDALGEALIRIFPPEGNVAAVESVEPVGPWSEGHYSSSEFG